jgi:ABC-type multidrug transport system ATPase subunit
LTLGADVDGPVVHALLDELGLDGDRFIDLEAPLLADGRGFSSGERVRLVLARCLLTRPSLLVLDDIAGVLDPESREQVRRALASRPEPAIIEATVDTPLMADVALQIAISR